MRPLNKLEISGVPGNLRSPDSLRMLQDLSRALVSAVEALQVEQPLSFEGGIDFYEEVRRFEIGLIERALCIAGGQQKRAASLLGIKKTTLNAKIKLYGIRNNAALRLTNSAVEPRGGAFDGKGNQ